jgi:phytoene synthase
MKPMNDEVERSYRACRQIARRAASNFAWAFWLLPADQRRGMEALYAFARHSDDLADGPEPIDQKRQGLAAWRDQLERSLGGEPIGQVYPALADAVRKFQIPPDYLRQIVTGVEMDLDHAGFATFADLRHYCEHVASAVGLACLAIWGCRDERAFEPATDCGVAFQLTNILRDLKEDAAAGRCYLPCEDLEQFLCGPAVPAGQASPANIASQVMSDRDDRTTFDNWLSVIRFECRRAAELYERSAVTANYLPGRGRRMFRLMHGTYRALLAKIERNPAAVLAARQRVSRPQKAWIAMRTLLG